MSITEVRYGLPKNQVKAIGFYHRKGCNSLKIQKYFKEVFEVDLKISEIEEAISFLIK